MIDKKFYKGSNQPIARDVGELREILNELPHDLPVETWGNPIKVVLYNHGRSDMHLSFEEAEDGIDDMDDIDDDMDDIDDDLSETP